VTPEQKELEELEREKEREELRQLEAEKSSAFPVIGPGLSTKSGKAGIGTSPDTKVELKDPTESELATFGIEAARSIPLIGAGVERGGKALFGDEFKRRTSAMREQNPSSAALGTLTGAAASVPLGGAASKAIGGAGRFAEMARQFLNPTGGVIARSVGEGSQAAADAALRGNDALATGGLAGGLTAAMGGVGAVAGKTKELFTDLFLGIPDSKKVREQYLKDPKGVLSADPRSIIDRMTKESNALYEPVVVQKKAAEQAKLDYKSAADRANLAAQAARKALSSETPSADVTRQIADGVKAYRNNIKMMSRAAADTLTEADKISAVNALNTLRQRLDSARVDGSPIPTMDAGANEKFISDWYNFLTKPVDDGTGNVVRIPKDIRPKDIKTLIQAIDEETDKAWDKIYQGAPLTPSERTALELRKSFDQDLKSIPAYRKAMAPVAQEMDFLENQALRYFSSPSKIESSLKKIKNRGGSEVYDVLGQIDQKMSKTETPTELRKGIDDFLWTRKALNDPFEWEKYREGLLESRLAQDLQSKMLSEQEKLAKMEPESEWLQQFRTPEKAENFVSTMTGGRPPKIFKSDAISKLDQEAKTDFVKQLENLRTQKVLNSGRIAGSRNVNLGAMLGGGASMLGGMALGQVAAPGAEFTGGGVLGTAGGILGALIGAAADKNAGRIYRRMIDASQSKAFKSGMALVEAAAQTSPRLAAQVYRQYYESNPEFRREADSIERLGPTGE
jgi:hypothetical protein